MISVYVVIINIAYIEREPLCPQSIVQSKIERATATKEKVKEGERVKWGKVRRCR